jgi:hypothetical protein
MSEIEWQPEKHPTQRNLRSGGIVTSDLSPKYRKTEVCPESTRNDCTTFKNREVDSTRISGRDVFRKADPSIYLTEAGMNTEVRDEQFENARGPISRMCEPGSN